MLFDPSACVVQLSAALSVLQLHRLHVLHKSCSLLGLYWRHDKALMALEVCSVSMLVSVVLIKKNNQKQTGLPEICTVKNAALSHSH